MPTAIDTSQMRALEELLAEDLAACRRRESEAYDAAARPGRPVVLFGAGGLGRQIAEMMTAGGIAVAALADNARHLQGTRIAGIPVLSPADAARQFGADADFVVTIWSAFAPGTMPERIAELRKFGCRNVIPFHYFLWKNSACLPYFNVDLPSRLLEQREAVLRCAELWEDQASLTEFAGQVRARLHADFDGLAPPDEHREYFPSDLISWHSAETYVDAGAFDGDSLASFIESCGGEFARAIAYEPDPTNFAKLTSRLNGGLEQYQPRISVRQQAVSDRPGSVSFLAGEGMSSRFGTGEVQVQAVALDSLLDEGIVPTFMKFDVEGFEPQALAGAEGIIRRHAPAMAICVYHRQEHLWTLPLAVHACQPRYRYYLRPYGFVWDEVCYALPR